MNAKTYLLSNSKTFSKPLALLLGLLLGTTLLWAGDKAWKAKPYQQWNEKEIEAILTDSPWVRVTPIQRSWLPGTETDNAPQERGSVGAKGQTSTAGPPSTAPVGAGEDTRDMNVQVYWQSSRVMRAATARQAVLHGENLDVDKYVSQPQDEYQIIVRMQDMTPFRQHDEKFFQGNAFLQMKKGKDKIPPTHVVYEKNSTGSVQDAIFFFPKTNPSSAPTISADETEVQFSCKIADTTVRVGFKLRDMVDQSGPAL
ncbi:MAG TPA: hypothetical protein VJP02_23755 [Candidatus Sulfotelmatobacter sp.]|nr:hypothetical protein [Candidatus Sulfotelmatobacter sp.]